MEDDANWINWQAPDTNERMERCETCKSSKMTDLTHGQGKHRNYYCSDCKSHCWRGIWYTEKEWDKWIAPALSDYSRYPWFKPRRRLNHGNKRKR